MSEECTNKAYLSQYDIKLAVRHAILLTGASSDFEASHYGIQNNIKLVLIIFECFFDISVQRVEPFGLVLCFNRWQIITIEAKLVTTNFDCRYLELKNDACTIS